MSISRSVLVTGGAGYIGAHAAKALHRVGVTPVVYDDLSNGHRAAVQWGPLVVGDVRDGDHLVEVMNDYGVGGVIHFAGLLEVGRSTADPAAFWDINVNGVAAVPWAMRETGVRRIVFSSTAAVYGQPAGAGDERLSESAPRPSWRTAARPQNAWAGARMSSPCRPLSPARWPGGARPASASARRSPLAVVTS